MFGAFVAHMMDLPIRIYWALTTVNKCTPAVSDEPGTEMYLVIPHHCLMRVPTLQTVVGGIGIAKAQLKTAVTWPPGLTSVFNLNRMNFLQDIIFCCVIFPCTIIVYCIAIL